MEYKERYLSAFLAVIDTSRGTLWLVKEPVWISNIRDYVDIRFGRAPYPSIHIYVKNLKI